MAVNGEEADADRRPTPEQLARQLVDALITRFTSLRRPLVVAIDGRSGAGKSTLAAALAAELRARGLTVTVIDGDEFYGGGSAERWDQRSPAENADHVIDWRRQRVALDDLRLYGSASWYPFDWEAPDWDSDHVPMRATPTTVESADVVILEGAYSGRPELHDLVDLRLLLDTPSEIRRRQLLEREGVDNRTDWRSRWSAAEDHYFALVMTPDHFGQVL